MHSHIHSLSLSLSRTHYTSRLHPPPPGECDYSQTLGPEYFCIILFFFLFVIATHVLTFTAIVIPDFGHWMMLRSDERSKARRRVGKGRTEGNATVQRQRGDSTISSSYAGI